MGTTVFINVCMCKEASHTLELCREYLAGKECVDEIDLTGNDLRPFDHDMIKHRMAIQESEAWDDPICDLARRVAAADEIVIGAPYWDLSFPSALKVLIEHTTVNGVTFLFTEEGSYVGLCRAKRIVYIASCGGYVAGANFGYEYVCGIANMYGIPEVIQVTAEGMDVVGMDTQAQMDKARAELARLG